MEYDYFILFRKILNNLFGDKLFKNLYLSGIVIGGLTYVLSYNIFPAFKGVDSVMIGASAGVMSVLFYLASYNPQRIIRIFFFDIKIIYIALFLFLYDIVQIPINNSGGHIAHIGGAIFGYIYIKQIKKQTKYNTHFKNIFKKIINQFKPTKKFKSIYKKPKSDYEFNTQKARKQKKIDQILEKISNSGYESLSSAEKTTLFNASKK